MYRPLRIVLFVHGLITLAGAIVLTAFPTAIPSAVGIAIALPEYLLVYLVAAAELAVAVLSFGGVLDLVYLGLTEANGTLIGNAVLRFTVVAVFLLVWRAARRHQT